jgi:hypothetical protein
MLTDPGALLAGFSDAADNAGIEGWPRPVRLETLPAPHERPPLPPDEAAVYAFTLSAAAGHSAPCEPGTVLMVGKARANNEQRFEHAHCGGTSDTSALAGSLLAHRILWPWLGISHLDEATVGEWMLSTLDRTQFLILIGNPHVQDPPGGLHAWDGGTRVPSPLRLWRRAHVPSLRLPSGHAGSLGLNWRSSPSHQDSPQ